MEKEAPSFSKGICNETSLAKVKYLSKVTHWVVGWGELGSVSPVNPEETEGSSM